VVAVPNVSSTYHVPLLLEKQGLVALVRDILKLDAVAKSAALVEKGRAVWSEWKALTTAQERLYETVTIALVGKYTNLHDSYLSVIKSLEHSCMRVNRKLDLVWVDASHLETETSTTAPADFHKAWHSVCTADGILVPGGFGHRGTEGMIAAAKWARTNKTPYLGICLGMQIAVIEFARHVVGLTTATSEELHANAEHRVVKYMPEVSKEVLGGTMRLGLRPTVWQPGSEWSKLRQLYGVAVGRSVLERHRHRYEVEPDVVARLEEKGMQFVGKDDKGERMEILELPDEMHPWFVGVQFHPEYLSRVLAPSKPYLGFVAASAGCLDDVMERAGEMGVTERLGRKMVDPETNGITNGVMGVTI
jgi:CTP synthase